MKSYNQSEVQDIDGDAISDAKGMYTHMDRRVDEVECDVRSIMNLGGPYRSANFLFTLHRSLILNFTWF